MPKHLLCLAIATMAAQPALAGTKFLIGETRVAPQQAQSGFAIEFQLLEAQGQGDFSLKDSGTVCYSATETANCFSSVAQHIDGDRDPQTGRIEFWEYGINFVAPQGQSMATQVLFSNIHGLRPASGNTNDFSVIVPNFLGSTAVTALGQYAEALFVASKDRRMMVRARLIPARATTPAAESK